MVAVEVVVVAVTVVVVAVEVVVVAVTVMVLAVSAVVVAVPVVVGRGGGGQGQLQQPPLLFVQGCQQYPTRRS